jgi:hypothetical protein
MAHNLDCSITQEYTARSIPMGRFTMGSHHSSPQIIPLHSSSVRTGQQPFMQGTIQSNAADVFVQPAFTEYSRQHPDQSNFERQVEINDECDENNDYEYNVPSQESCCQPVQRSTAQQPVRYEQSVRNEEKKNTLSSTINNLFANDSIRNLITTRYEQPVRNEEKKNALSSTLKNLLTNDSISDLLTTFADKFVNNTLIPNHTSTSTQEHIPPTVMRHTPNNYNEESSYSRREDLSNDVFTRPYSSDEYVAYPPMQYKNPNPYINGMTLTTKKYRKMYGVEIYEKVIKRKNGEETQNFVVISNQVLINLLKNIANWTSLYEICIRVEMSKVLCSLQFIKKANKEKKHTELIKFINVIESFNKEKLIHVKNMLLKGKISYDSLWYLFTGDKSIVHNLNGELSAGNVFNVEYDSYNSTFIIYYYTYLKSVNDSKMRLNHMALSTDSYSKLGYKKTLLMCKINEYVGVKDISSLPIQLLSREQKSELSIRGAKYIELTKSDKPEHVMYKGNMIVNFYGKTTKIQSSGRVMIDIEGFYQYNPNNNYCNNLLFDYDCEFLPSIPTNDLWAVYPFLYGYGLSQGKKWGELAVNGISKIVYNDNAYNELYLPLLNGLNKKELIVSFIKNKHNFIKDSIKGKGEGVIFLLHGPSGVGKTLTAEATAEILHVPLYYVNAGDIGNEATVVDNNMHVIISLADRWNATVLIDEADVFVEKRSTTDIHRNAIVGTFLRILEYYNGIIFLTTNRVTEFDDAIMNRVHVKFEYDKLTQEGREQIWNILLNRVKQETSHLYAPAPTYVPYSDTLSSYEDPVREEKKETYSNRDVKSNKDFLKIGEININTISNLELNGRQIRTCINLAFCLARKEGVPLCTEHILKVKEMKFF